MARAFILASTLLALGCGTKSGLAIEPEALALPDGEVPECLSRVDCEDGLGCTNDACEAGRCRQRIDDAACATGSVCAIGRCDRSSGCVSTPVDCDDRIVCTVDACVDPTGCDHTPDDALCPISHRCDVDRGCVAQAWVHDNNALYSVDLPTGDVRRLTSLAARFTDIALSSDRQLYAVNFTSVFIVDDRLGGVAPLFDSPGELVALEELTPGLLVAAGQDDRILGIDLASGASEVLARLPTGWVASGDIGFVRERMLVTVTDDASSEAAIDHLAEVSLGDGTATILGPTGFSCIWGVAAFGELLYGFTCRGQLLRIDPFTGDAEILRDLDLRIGGAAAR